MRALVREPNTRRDEPLAERRRKASSEKRETEQDEGYESCDSKTAAQAWAGRFDW